jgi:hypothetical protein
MARKSGGARRKAARPMKSEAEIVAETARKVGVPEAQIPNLRMTKIVDLSGELGKKNSIVSVLVNRGGTAVERWITNDKAGLFGEPQQRAIRYTQGLWVRAEGHLRATDHARDVVDQQIEGMSQQEALDELQRFKAQVPRPYWDCYENVCRFDEEAGTAGSKIASNSRSAVDAAKTTVAFTASLIAMWRHL